MSATSTTKPSPKQRNQSLPWHPPREDSASSAPSMHLKLCILSSTVLSLPSPPPPRGRKSHLKETGCVAWDVHFPVFVGGDPGNSPTLPHPDPDGDPAPKDTFCLSLPVYCLPLRAISDLGSGRSLSAGKPQSFPEGKMQSLS